jgi:hypothetical protein
MKIGEKRANPQWLDQDRDDAEAFGQVLAGKLGEFTGTGLGPQCNLHYSNVRIAYTHLYGFDMEGVGANANSVTRSGNQGNIAELRVPGSAALLRKAYNIVVGPELTWSAVATTTDYASEAQAVTARNALEYFWKHQSMGASCKASQFESMAFGESILHMPWDPNAGPIVGVQPPATPDGEPKPLRSGWVRFARVPTWDIIRDPTAHSRESLNFIIVREWPDKYDVADGISDPDPEVAEKKRQECLSIGASPPTAQAWLPFRTTFDGNTQRIPVYYLYAKPSPSCPQGRQTVFLQTGTVLSDAPLDERYINADGTCELPTVWAASGEYTGTPWPYTKYFGILGSEQARDALRRDLLTNATATSGNVIAVPAEMMDAGAAVAFETGGPQLVPIPPGTVGKIEVLELQQSHPEHFKLLQTLGSEEQQIMGLDQLTAGVLDSMPSSGALAALMTSTSVQNNSQEQANWTNFVQRCGNVMLAHIKKMPTPIRIALAGNARSALVTTTEVSGTQVSGIERVIVTIGGALEQTDAGKYEIAVEALKNQWVKTPEQFQTVRDTGRLDALTEDLSNELLLIKSENERLAKCEQVVVLLTDDHRLHIKGHAAVTSSVTAREDPRVVQAAQAHIDAHIRALRETDPAILQILGQPAMTPPVQDGTGAPAPGVPSTTKPPQAEQKAQAPSLPTNPATGQRPKPNGTTPPALAIKQN